MTKQTEKPQPIWMVTDGVVTACRYRFARMSILTAGVASDANSFVISFAYRAHGNDLTPFFVQFGV